MTSQQQQTMGAGGDVKLNTCVECDCSITEENTIYIDMYPNGHPIAAMAEKKVAFCSMVCATFDPSNYCEDCNHGGLGDVQGCTCGLEPDDGYDSDE